MHAPTVWEEGRWSGGRVTRFSVFACAVLVATDLALTGRLGAVFDLGFVVLSVAMALAVRPRDFFRVGVLPPMLVLGTCVLLAVGRPETITHRGDGVVQAVVSGLAHHSGPLTAAYGLALAVLAMRTRVLRLQAKRATSPAPSRTISAAPSVRSTTVVGSEPASPSITASTN